MNKKLLLGLLLLTFLAPSVSFAISAPASEKESKVNLYQKQKSPIKKPIKKKVPAKKVPFKPQCTNVACSPASA